ncbi:MAG: multidrug effflux MFS transporter [Pseudomonadota bacterium]
MPRPSTTTPPSILTLVIMAAVSAASLNVFLPSLPKMAVAFETSYAVIQLAVAGYLFLTGFVQLLIGPLSDRYGRRPVALVTFGTFALASIGAALSQTLELFFVFRALQAAAVAGFVLSRAMIRDVYGPDDAASMIGYVTMCMALIPMLAPVFGGFLDDALGWRANFWALAAFGMVLTAMIYFDAGETNTVQNASFTDQFRAYPELFASKRFWGYAFTGAFSVGAFFAYLGGGPFIGAEIYGLTPAQVGLCLGIPPTGYLIGNGISGLYASRVGIMRMILIGTFTQAVLVFGAVSVSLSGIQSPWAFFAFLAGIGLGNGMILPSATAGVLNVRPRLAGSAAGLSGALATFAGAIFSGWVASLLGPESTAFTLAICIFCSALLGFFAALLTAYWEARTPDQNETSAAPSAKSG